MLKAKKENVVSDSFTVLFDTADISKQDLVFFPCNDKKKSTFQVCVFASGKLICIIENNNFSFKTINCKYNVHSKFFYEQNVVTFSERVQLSLPFSVKSKSNVPLMSDISISLVNFSWLIYICISIWIVHECTYKVIKL